MILIWGFRSAVETLAMVFAQCVVCGSPAAQRLSLIKRRFTLFFIPVLTYRKTYALTCSLCGATTKVEPEEAQRLQAAVVQAEAHESGNTAPPAPIKNDKFVL